MLAAKSSLKVPENHVKQMVAKLSAMSVTQPHETPVKKVPEKQPVQLPEVSTPKHVVDTAEYEDDDINDLLDLTVIDKEDYELPYDAPLPPLPEPETSEPAIPSPPTETTSKQELMFAAVKPATKRMCKMTEHCKHVNFW